MLAGRLRGECLPDTGRTEEVDDEPLTFTAYEVVEHNIPRVKHAVCLYERAEKALTIL